MTEPIRRVLEFERRRARDSTRRRRPRRPTIATTWLRPRSCARCISKPWRRIERSGYDVFSLRVRVPQPVAGAIALQQWLWPLTSSMSSSSAPDFAGLERRRPADARRRACARARSALAARRTRDGIRRSRDRRAGRQRPARSARLLSRDVRVPARYRRVRSRPRRSRSSP